MTSDRLSDYFKLNKRQLFFILRSLTISLVCIFCLSYLTYNYLVPVEKHVIFNESDQSNSAFIIYFLILFLPLSYLFNCFLCRQWLIPNYKSLIMYMGMILLCASTIEVLLDSLFVLALNRPSWVYHIWPVHNGYTSGAMLFIWPWYGFHFYFFHKSMEIRNADLISSGYVRAVFTAIDAMSLETIVNTFALLLFHSYYFFYLQSDLYHFTTTEIFIPYFLTGLLNVVFIHYLDRETMPRFWIGIVAYLLGVFSILVLG